MFTGLIERVGVLDALKTGSEGGRLGVRCSSRWDADPVVGESIAVQGACLTVAALAGEVLYFDVLGETLRRTCLGEKRLGDPLNLERALPAQGRFGGHMVSGHVDGRGTLTGIRRVGGDYALTIACDTELLRDVLVKGSIALDGISLTVTAVTSGAFEVHIIPHTWERTNLRSAVPGQTVNLEVDMTVKAIRHHLTALLGGSGGTLSLERLRSAGF